VTSPRRARKLAAPVSWKVRYGCPDHRGDLVAYVRKHYGTVGHQPWKMPPDATSRRSRDTERAIADGGLSPMPTWSLPS
jgi:hypothetical protein